MARRSSPRRVAERDSVPLRLREAQAIVDLAEKEGYFDSCKSKKMNKAGRKVTKERLHQAVADLLCGQYPELRTTLEPVTMLHVDANGPRPGGASVVGYRVVLKIKRRFT